MNPLFTLLIPSFNTAKTLARCLEAACKQQAGDLEVLLMDGGSTDNTLSVARSFAARLKLTIVSEPDNGLYDAMNKGVARALGEWIVILGADDELAPGALETVRKAIMTHPSEIYAGEALLATMEYRRLIKSDPWEKQALVSGIPSCHNAVFISRKAYSVVGEYDTSYNVSADANWAHRAIKIGVPCHLVNTVLTVFHDGGVSSNAALTMPESYRVVQDNFPCLTLEDAEYLLYMAKGWKSDAELETLLAKYPGEHALAEAAYAARDFAPHCAQRFLDAAYTFPSPPLWKRAYQKTLRTLRCLFFHA